MIHTKLFHNHQIVTKECDSYGKYSFSNHQRHKIFKDFLQRTVIL